MFTLGEDQFRSYRETGMNFELPPRYRILRRSFSPDINASNLDCLAPRPECGAGSVVVGLGEGAKRDAPAFFQHADVEDGRSLEFIAIEDRPVLTVIVRLSRLNLK